MPIEKEQFWIQRRSYMQRDQAAFSDILTSVQQAISYVEDVEYTQFLKDQILQDACIRRLELIGEAARRVSTAGKAMAPDIPWREMIGMRNIMIHEYDKVDMEFVWITIHNDLPGLLQPLQQLLSP